MDYAARFLFIFYIGAAGFQHLQEQGERCIFGFWVPDGTEVQTVLLDGKGSKILLISAEQVAVMGGKYRECSIVLNLDQNGTTVLMRSHFPERKSDFIADTVNQTLEIGNRFVIQKTECFLTEQRIVLAAGERKGVILSQDEVEIFLPKFFSGKPGKEEKPGKTKKG